MDVTSLFSGVDNLFKFLFIGGIVMVLTSMFYPLQKEQELDVEIINYNKDVKLLNRDLKYLSQGIVKLKASAKNSENQLVELHKAKESTINKVNLQIIDKQIKSIKTNFNSTYDSLYKQKQTTEVKKIIIEFNQSKITLLHQYADSYNGYTSKLLWWGIGFLIFGLIGWVISTVNSERLKLKEINS